MKKRAIIAAMAVVAMVGCQKESDQVGVDISSTVSFSSTGIATTRTTEISDGDGGYLDAWESGDGIGIFSSGYTSNGFTEEYANVEHAAICQEPSTSTDFEVQSDDNALLKPNSMSSDITYYAYYPYTSSVDEDGVITVDISKQDTESGGNLGDADFMVAATTITAPQDEVAFTFSHMLSKVQFKVSFDEEVTARDEEAVVSDLTAYVSSLPKATYDIYGQFIEVDASYPSGYYKMSSTVDGDQAIFTAILHPGAGMAFELEFCIGDQKYLVDISALEFSAGMIHTYNVVLGSKEVRFTGESTINEWEGDTPSEDISGDLLTPALSWDGSVATDFNGVAFDSNITEYKISSGSELALLSELIKAGNLMEGITFTMTGNFTLSDREWIPIKYDNSSFFLGTLDGGGYAISGLNINYESLGCGLFAFIGKGSTIKNLTVKGSMVVYSKWYTGAIVGYNNFGTVEDCNSDVTITTVGEPTYTGGIVGINNSGTITGCCNRGDVAGYTGVGGVVGWNYDGTITGCYSTGEVTGNSNVGGVVGYNKDGAITGCYNRGDVTGDSSVGGVIGYNEECVITGCYNRGEINGNSIVGGVVGNTSSVSADKGAVKQSFNTGAVKGEEYIGGVVGKNNEYGIIQSVYNTGEVSGTSYVGGVTSYNGSNTSTTVAYNTAKVSGTEYIGGVVGYNIYSSTYLFSYYNEEKGEGTNSIYGYNSSSNTSGAIFSDPDADITIGSYSKPLVDLLNLILTSAVWESDIENVNDGFPILTSINY